MLPLPCQGFPGYLQQRCLAEEAGQGVELPDEQPQLVHRQLVLTLSSPGAVPATTRAARLLITEEKNKHHNFKARLDRA